MNINAPSVMSSTGPRMAWIRLTVFMEHLRPGRITRSVPADAFVQHIPTEHNQSHWPIADELMEPNDVHRIQQEQNADCDQHHWGYRKPASSPLHRHDARKLIHILPHLPPAGRMIGFERHVEPPHPDHHAEQRLQTARRIGADDTDQYPQDDHVDDTLDVLTVVDCAYAGDHAKNECQSRRNTWVKRMRRGVSPGVRRRSRRFVRRRPSERIRRLWSRRGGWFRWNRRRRDVLLAVDRSRCCALAAFTQCLAARPAVRNCRFVAMIYAVHFFCSFGAGCFTCCCCCALACSWSCCSVHSFSRDWISMTSRKFW